MSMFIMIPIVDKTGKKLEDLRVNTSSIDTYRKWMTNDGKKQTVIFLKGAEEKRLIADVPVDLIDELVEVKCISAMV